MPRCLNHARKIFMVKKSTRSWFEVYLYATALAFILGHVANLIFSPKPLNPLWNMISQYAASDYGGRFVTLGIEMFGFAQLLLGITIISKNYHRQSWQSFTATILLFIGSLPMILIGVYPTFKPNENPESGILGKVGDLIFHKIAGNHTATELTNNHLHNVNSMYAFPILLLAIFLLRVSFCKSAKFKRFGIIGIMLVPVIAALLWMAYHCPYNGTWQRSAFIISYCWMIAMGRCLNISGDLRSRRG